jgi:hypothetical protein
VGVATAAGDGENCVGERDCRRIMVNYQPITFESSNIHLIFSALFRLIGFASMIFFLEFVECLFGSFNWPGLKTIWGILQKQGSGIGGLIGELIGLRAKLTPI